MDLEGNPTTIKIKMFGDFSISINENVLPKLKGRTKRVWMLIQYLIANRSQTVPLDRLVEDIWDGKTCGDPENALKNLVYRARVLLRDLSGESKSQFIIFLNGTYIWNNKYECDVDTEKFMEYYSEAEKAYDTSSRRINSYKKMLETYQGCFLPKSAYSKWVVALDTRYSELYCRGVSTVCRILGKLDRYAEIASICESALKYFPYEQSIHKTLLSAYVSTGQRGKAFDHYNWATKLFYREFGVDLSDSLLPYYKELISSGSPVEPDLAAIKNDLREASGASGAYFCDYDSFKCIYRTQARMIARTGQSVFLALFTISSPEGDMPAASVYKSAAERLKNVVLANLRKGDTVSFYSATQFIVLLPLATYENVQCVVNRIIRKFRFDYRKDNVKLSVRISPLD